jgi:hypothetical protein
LLLSLLTLALTLLSLLLTLALSLALLTLLLTLALPLLSRLLPLLLRARALALAPLSRSALAVFALPFPAAASRFLKLSAHVLDASKRSLKSLIVAASSGLGKAIGFTQLIPQAADRFGDRSFALGDVRGVSLTDILRRLLQPQSQLGLLQIRKGLSEFSRRLGTLGLAGGLLYHPLDRLDLLLHGALAVGQFDLRPRGHTAGDFATLLAALLLDVFQSVIESLSQRLRRFALLLSQFLRSADHVGNAGVGLFTALLLHGPECLLQSLLGTP